MVIENKKPVIGVLALQGAVELHRPHIEAAGGVYKPVKTPEEFAAVDAFILPGGESTTMLKLIDRFNLWDILAAEFAKKPVWGICAGSILLARDVTNPQQKSFGVLPIAVERNGYGRQLESHYEMIEGFEVSFIRAPIIIAADRDVEVLAQQNGKPVWVQKGHAMASTFHPELTRIFPSPMHRKFIEMVQA